MLPQQYADSEPDGLTVHVEHAKHDADGQPLCHQQRDEHCQSVWNRVGDTVEICHRDTKRLLKSVCHPVAQPDADVLSEPDAERLRLAVADFESH